MLYPSRGMTPLSCIFNVYLCALTQVWKATKIVQVNECSSPRKLGQRLPAEVRATSLRTCLVLLAAVVQIIRATAIPKTGATIQTRNRKRNNMFAP